MVGENSGEGLCLWGLVSFSVCRRMCSISLSSFSIRDIFDDLDISEFRREVMRRCILCSFHGWCRVFRKGSVISGFVLVRRRVWKFGGGE